jgi:hypothetical protein
VPLLRKLGCLSALVLGLVVVLAVTALLAPWAFHIGGQWTPGFWWGYGKLRATNGVEYPIYIYFSPNFRSMTRLRLNGQRPISGLIGGGWLCAAPGVTQRLDLTGDMYGNYLTTDGDQMNIRLLDWRHVIRINPQNRRYVDFLGRWNGSELPMQESYGWEQYFQPGTHDSKAHASITFTAGSYADFKNACAAAAIPDSARIPPPRN